MANGPVELKYLASESFAPGGGVPGVRSTMVVAKVNNLAFAKDVELVYTQGDGSWSAAPLTFLKTFGDHDVFQRNDNAILVAQCALRYSSNGQTFWDNNAGVNYSVDEVRPNTVGGNVVLNRATARRGSEAGGGFTFTTSWVEGEIWVKNLSFNKRVGIRLSANGWATFDDTLATFSGTVATNQGISQVEIWKFKTAELNLDTSTPDFAFAVFYVDEDNGAAFWDDNGGQNFRLSKNDGAGVE